MHSLTVYTQRIFLLKFAKPERREQLVIDSGFRCHLTSFTRATAAAPSPFVTRLRKYLRTRRVTSVSQVGTDRVIEFQFSDGQYRLFLEFYAGGNIVLTDNELTIIALLRIVPEGPEQEELRIGLKYLLHQRQNYKGVLALTRERVRHALQRAVDKGVEDVPAAKKKAKKRTGDTLRRALAASLNEFPPMLLDHALQVKQFDADSPLEDILNSESKLDGLMLALEEAQHVISNITSGPICKGFIIAKALKAASAADISDTSPAQEKLAYEDFHPFRPAQFEGIPNTQLLEFEPFNKLVDEFFSSIESQKLESRLTEREENAKRKLDTARADHAKRLGGLQQVQELNMKKAEAIEANLQNVQEAIAAVNGLIAQGMDWVEIARLIEMEQAKGNPVAEMIKLPLKLYENTATLLLAEAIYQDEEDYEGNETGSDLSENDDEGVASKGRTSNPEDKRLAVDVDLALSPWSNARQYYDQKKSAAVKEQKTLQSSGKALKSTERKVAADLKKGLKQEKQVMRPVRIQKWFEKFMYFISSEGYLVIGGRDAQQNEVLYKRYLRKGDVYVHGDMEGAASVIVKSKPGFLGSPIPLSTLSQAGILAVATSSAWDAKAGMSAWWVKPDQVSRTAPTGEYLTTGAFTIRGQKNYLPPAQLLLGFGVMFQVSEESKARHLKHRVADENIVGTESALQEVRVSSEQADGHPIVVPDSRANGVDITDEQRQYDQQPCLTDNEQINSDEHKVSDVAEGDMLSDEQNGTDDEPSEREEGSTERSEEDHEEEIGDTEHDAGNPLQPHLHAQESEDASEPGSEDESSPQGVEANGSLRPPEAAQRKDYSKTQQDLQDRQPPATNRDGAIPGVHHISARERRLLHQNRQSTTDEAKRPQNSTASADAEQSGAVQTTESIEQTPNSAPKTQATHVRGKHGKRNKLKAKYADQDEEDRALALRVLGSAAGHQKAVEDAASKKAKEEELAAQKERRRRQHALALEKGKEAEEIRRLHMEESIDMLEDAEADELNNLDAYVGTPLPGDEILDALVVCGPWDAIGGRCRWRAKLQPGATKKGKAVREILGAWTAGIADREKKRRPPKEGESGEPIGEEEKVRSREAELIKAIREQEVIGMVPVGKCRVIMGGGGEKNNSGRGGVAAGKGKRGGKGSKKQR